MGTRLLPLLASGLLLCCALALPARAEIAIVAHPDCHLREISPQQLSDLYLGRVRSIGGDRLIPIDQPRDSELRARFFLGLNGMELRRVNAYWARLQFSGDTQPPMNLPDNKAVLETVRANPRAIGYVDAGAASAGGVRVLAVIK